jgi:hypothetical protein
VTFNLIQIFSTYSLTNCNLEKANHGLSLARLGNFVDFSKVTIKI